MTEATLHRELYGPKAKHETQRLQEQSQCPHHYQDLKWSGNDNDNDTLR